DVLTHMPVSVVDRRAQTGVALALPGMIVTLKLTIDKHQAPPPGTHRMPYRVFARDPTGEIQLTWFVSKAPWLEASLPPGAERYVSGLVTSYQGQKQISHADHIVAPENLADLPLIEPIYPLTFGLSPKSLRKAIGGALDALPDLPEWIPGSRLTQRSWPPLKSALAAIHRAEALEAASLTGPARMRLAYDEYLAGQITLMIVRQTLTRDHGIARAPTGALSAKIIAALPFALTSGQQQAFAEITADLKSAHRMARLLQGDVGSGKTLVALLAMAAVAETGAQSALMAPTELLAAQHFRTIDPFCRAAGIGCVLLTGKLDSADKAAGLAALAAGTAAIAVGTHALFQSGVEFRNLGLTVVDEQHRFGVHQRLALSEKGRRAELLVMTATPIPRSLVLTHFGDMDVSKLPEKPAGRQPIDTAVLPASAYDRVIARLRARVEDGAQAFWVCPLVEESELVRAISVEERYAALRDEFGDKVGLVHGRLGASEKQAVMDAFLAGKLSILVATTVIEVGVDVPNATIMIIEHAERFGLAQLHQLRGRVGRGTQRSACLLLHAEPLGEMAKARLETIRTTEDGFLIAEKDLELRGQGDLLGTRQSGMPGYRLAIPDVHGGMLEFAHDDARMILAGNPGLAGPSGEAIRTLLYFHRRDLAIPLIKSG
ncbi:MAG: ATP-dependent DNA helicase RecG, partial [Cucumibacter sp.]